MWSLSSRREDCATLVSALEKAQRVLDELRSVPLEGGLFETSMQ